MFTQTVRALDAGVTEIPPIELPYFDTASGSYKVASSKAIPLVVNATNVVTASDAEGLSPVLGQTSEIQAWTRGIAHNYEDIGALQHHRADPSAWLQSPVMLALVGAPPVTYAALFCLMFAARRRSANPDAARARRALGELSAQLGKAADSDAILEALRGFLGAKLRRPAGALTANDLEQPLLDRGADPQDVVEVRAIFTECEASRYAGTGGGGGSAELAARALAAARNLDKQIA